MSCVAHLKKFMFTHARLIGGEGLIEPDGRPLYSYRCSNRFYQELRSQAAAYLQAALYRKPPPGFEASFCLYAAETFHREHSGGPWAWKTVFSPLDAAVPPNPVVGRWVESGLTYWKRRLLTGADGQRLALVTIACEGGLPLRLLHKEGAHLRTFFQRMLHDHHELGMAVPDLHISARRNITHLQKSLRNEEVIQLAAALVGRTVDLQRDIGKATDPIAMLDETHSHWRSTLPLRLDDEVASALFKNLVEDSQQIALAAAARPAWIGSLAEDVPGQFSVYKEFRFPDRLPAAHVSEWLDNPERLPTRLRLRLNAGHGSEPLAVLTLFARDGERPAYRREWLRGDKPVLSGAAVFQPHTIGLHDGSRECLLAFRGDAEWGECPWIFVASATAAGHWRWLTEGSASTRSEEALVVAPDGCLPEPSSDGTCDCQGSVVSQTRLVYRITGTVEFYTADGERYRVHCGAKEDSRRNLRLRGDEVHSLLNAHPVFLGVPRFQDDSISGAALVASEEMQWRPCGLGGTWRSVQAGCVGRVWLRLVNTASGIERVRRRADVVPRTVEIQRRIGTTQQPGRYRLHGVGEAEVNVLQPTAATTKHSLETGTVEIDCAPVPNGSLVPLMLQLRWPDRAALTLEMPYPQKGAMFQLDDRTLLYDELVALDRLYGLWLVLQNSSGGERFILDAELVGGGLSATSLRQLGLVENLPPLQDGGLECNMGPWVDRVRAMLAATDDLAAMVRLTVQSQRKEDLARVRIARFDMLIHPQRETDSVFVGTDQLERLGEDWPSRVSMEMLRLWAPTEASRSLALRGDDPGVWSVPKDLPPGPWWIVGRDSGWARFRPLLWSVQSDGNEWIAPVVESELAAAVREGDSEKREERIDTVLRKMGDSPGHDDWELLLDYVALAGEFPPNSLDVLNQLIRHTRTLAMALFMADEARFDRLIRFGEEMPFAWGLLPVADWRHAAALHFGHLRDTLAGVEGVDDILWDAFEGFRSQAIAARPYFHPLCDWLQEQLFPGRKLINSSLELTRRLQTTFILSQVAAEEGELLGRHDADEHWPLATCVMQVADSDLIQEPFRFANLTAFQRPVRCAPFVAAAIALGNTEKEWSRETLAYELRTLRGFDSEWFDQAYAQGLALTLVLQNNEGNA